MKRFLDTGFLDQKWIRKLPPEKKIFLIYLMLKCDNGGIIDLDFEDAEFWIGKKIGDLSFLPEGYLILIDDSSKYFMPKFVECQYPNFPHSKVHQQAQAKEILIRNGVFNVDTQSIDLGKFYVNIKQSLPNTYTHGNGNVNGNDNGNAKEAKIDFEIFWNLYNKKVGSKDDCKKKWDKLSLPIQQFILDYLPKYLPTIKDKQYQPYPETWLNQKRWENEIITEEISRVDGYKFE